MNQAKMSGRSEKDKAKLLQDKCQLVLNTLLRDEDNKYCVDCDAKGPRWASWNLGIFLCIRCAGIHRNLGVHISKVKSVNLDSWTPEQVVSLQQMGNSKARAIYEANLPDNFKRPQNDMSLETFIRSKYEQKKYIAREWVPEAAPKVNWEKEIEEDLEKQKKKKTAARVVPSVEIPPPIPKPSNSSSPKPAVKSATEDLLGLQVGAVAAPAAAPAAAAPEDDFSSFFSAPKPAAAASAAVALAAAPSLPSQATAKSQSQEEQDFFNQTVAQPQEPTKISKESILALYSKPPASYGMNIYPNQVQYSGYAPQQQYMPAQAGQMLQNQFANLSLNNHHNHQKL